MWACKKYEEREGKSRNCKFGRVGVRILFRTVTASSGGPRKVGEASEKLKKIRNVRKVKKGSGRVQASAGKALGRFRTVKG